MGCDIHMFVERKNPHTGKWEDVPAEGTAPQDSFEKKHGYWSWYGGRNYDLFAILANVRNGFGFAGVDTGDGFRPIAMPRGVPEDSSLDFASEVEQWGGDGHSHSYFTVAELDAYDWEGQFTKKRGILTPGNFAAMLRDGTPSGWSGGMFGDGVEYVNPDRMEQFLKTSHYIKMLEADVQRWEEALVDPRRADLRDNDRQRLLEAQTTLEVAQLEHDPSLDDQFDAKKSYYVRHEWKVSYKESAGYFYEVTLPALRKLGDPDSIRIVFFFDN